MSSLPKQLDMLQIKRYEKEWAPPWNAEGGPDIRKDESLIDEENNQCWTKLQSIFALFYAMFFSICRFLRASSSVQISSSVIGEIIHRQFPYIVYEVGHKQTFNSSDTFPQRRRKRKRRLEGLPDFRKHLQRPHQQPLQQHIQQQQLSRCSYNYNSSSTISNFNYSTLCVLQYFCSDLV